MHDGLTADRLRAALHVLGVPEAETVALVDAVAGVPPSVWRLAHVIAAAHARRKAMAYRAESDDDTLFDGYRKVCAEQSRVLVELAEEMDAHAREGLPAQAQQAITRHRDGAVLALKPTGEPACVRCGAPEGLHPALNLWTDQWHGEVVRVCPTGLYAAANDRAYFRPAGDTCARCRYPKAEHRADGDSLWCPTAKFTYLQEGR